LIGRFVSLPRSNQRTAIESRATVGGVTVIRRAPAPGPENPAWLTELALRLASDPAHVEAWAGEHLRSGLARLLDLSTLARAARFVVLATEDRLNPTSALGELDARRGWA
jgi:hypothetical protein